MVCIKLCHCQCGGSAVKSKVTQGVIICDVETDMDSYNTYPQIHTPTFMHNHMVPGAQMYDFRYVCVWVCFLSYGLVPRPPLRATGWVNILSTLGQSTTQFVPVDPCPACLYPLIWTEGNQADPVNNTQQGQGKPQQLLNVFVSYHQGQQCLSNDCGVGKRQYEGTIKMIQGTS